MQILLYYSYDRLHRSNPRTNTFNVLVTNTHYDAENVNADAQSSLYQ